MAQWFMSLPPARRRILVAALITLAAALSAKFGVPIDWSGVAVPVVCAALGC